MKFFLATIILSSIGVASPCLVKGQTPEPEFVTNSKGIDNREMLLLKTMDDLKLSRLKTNSVISIQNEFVASQKKMNIDKTILEADKKTKLKDLLELRKKKLKDAGLDDAEIKRVEDYYSPTQKNIPKH